jgi:hypothetical protein
MAWMVCLGTEGTVDGFSTTSAVPATAGAGGRHFQSGRAVARGFAVKDLRGDAVSGGIGRIRLAGVVGYQPCHVRASIRAPETAC